MLVLSRVHQIGVCAHLLSLISKTDNSNNIVAPEVIELQGASTKSDIWYERSFDNVLIKSILVVIRSLGCTLVELVTGKPPYSDLIAMSAMFRIVEDDYPPLPQNISEVKIFAAMKWLLILIYRRCTVSSCVVSKKILMIDQQLHN